MGDESSCVEESFRADKDEVAARKQPNNNIPTIDSGYNTASTDPRTSPHSITSSMSRQAIYNSTLKRVNTHDDDSSYTSEEAELVRRLRKEDRRTRKVSASSHTRKVQ